VVGFVQVTLLDVNLTGKPRYVTARVNDVVSLPNAIADDGAPESSNIHNVQLTM
jgi:hypothetical protein